MSRARQRSSSPVDVLTNNLGVGAAVGAVMFVVNYVVMYLFVTIDGVETGDEGWKTVGNLLYNAQFVDSEFTVSIGGESSSESYNVLKDAQAGSELTSTIPEILYQLAPIIVLIAGGFIVAKQAQTLDIGGSIAAAVSIVSGTLVLSVVGVFLFESSSQGGSFGPKLLMGILLVGIVIPAVAGAIGGAIADQV